MPVDETATKNRPSNLASFALKAEYHAWGASLIIALSSMASTVARRAYFFSPFSDMAMTGRPAGWRYHCTGPSRPAAGLFPFPSPSLSMSTSAGIADELAPPSSELSPAQTRRALFALGVGGFGIGTGEFVIMGLLPDAARDLGISIPQAGHLISIYALGVVIGAPLLAVLGARLPRRSFLIGLMLVFALGNMVSAMAPGFAPWRWRAS